MNEMHETMVNEGRHVRSQRGKPAWAELGPGRAPHPLPNSTPLGYNLAPMHGPQGGNQGVVQLGLGLCFREGKRIHPYVCPPPPN